MTDPHDTLMRHTALMLDRIFPPRPGAAMTEPQYLALYQAESAAMSLLADIRRALNDAQNPAVQMKHRAAREVSLRATALSLGYHITPIRRDE
jgi:hypothetical protein